MNRQIEKTHIDLIDVGLRHRQVTELSVSMMAQSMSRIGLQTPITVRAVMRDEDAGDLVLVAGATRLAAAKSLGWTHIDTIVVECTDVEAEMWEIAENLHRSELTKLERAEQINRWRDLLSQAGTKPTVRDTAAALNISRMEAQRASDLSRLTAQAKEAARDADIDDNQSALLEVAAGEPEQQVKLVAQVKEKRARGPRFDHTGNENQHDRDVLMLMGVWESACPSAQNEFFAAIENVMRGTVEEVPA